jgi:hypothetical protein
VYWCGEYFRVSLNGRLADPAFPTPARVAKAVRRLDGFVAKYMGDRVLVYFGYPRAHEDDAEQAVRAVLDIISKIAGLDVSDSLSAAPPLCEISSGVGKYVELNYRRNHWHIYFNHYVKRSGNSR